MAAETDLKWKLPGWRIESSYSNNVLIGNWDEERRKVSYWMINTLLMLMYQIKSRLGDIIPHCKCRDKHTKLFFSSIVSTWEQSLQQHTSHRL
jgi:hypothetical protein